jgi:hypothetical protein
MTGRTALASAALLALFGAGCGGPPAPEKPSNIESSSEKSSSKPEGPKDRPADKDKAPKGPPAVTDKTADKDKSAPADRPPPNPDVTPTKESGVIRGEVRRGGAGVGDAVVWVEAPPPTAASPAAAPAALTARAGGFRPHVAVARTGAALRLSAPDGLADFVASGKAAFSRSLKAGEAADEPLPRDGRVDVRSQLHPEWGAAYVHVFDLGFAAVTGPDGAFTLPALPPGEYTVVFWHESAPEKAVLRLKLAAGEGAALKWTLPEK